jgi:chromosome transmission fidelity protein 1
LITFSDATQGKTLSLLCASLTWLADEKDRARKGKLIAVTEDGVDGKWLYVTRFCTGNFICDIAKDWVVEQTRERVRREMEADERAYEDRLAQARKREDAMKRMAKARVVKKTVGTLNYLCDVMCHWMVRNLMYTRRPTVTTKSFCQKMTLSTVAKI